MVDIVDSITRSRMMSGIKGRNTKPELLIRSLLHKKGFRFRLHVKDLQGKPDIVLPKYRAILFIHGCFWHGHENCRLFKLPNTRTEFWQNKIFRNQVNDSKAQELLLAAGWRVGTIWECATRKSKKDPESIVEILTEWLRSNAPLLQIDEQSILIHQEAKRTKPLDERSREIKILEKS